MPTIPVVSDGDDILTSWAAAVARAINATTYDEGFVPYALPAGVHAGATVGATSNLAAVSGGNAGAAMVPIVLPGPMKIQSVTIRNGDTASARSCEFRLYRDNGDTTPDFVTGTDGTLSFTPGAASDRTGNVSVPGTLLLPGTYWAAIRNTSASQTFGISRVADATVLAGSTSSVVTTATVPALGATLNTALLSTLVVGPYLVRLNGRVLGASAAY